MIRHRATLKYIVLVMYWKIILMKVDFDINNVSFYYKLQLNNEIHSNIILENEKTVFCTFTIQDEKFMSQLKSNRDRSCYL